MCSGGGSEPCSRGGALGGTVGEVGRVRFGRQGQIERGLDQRQLALGRAQLLVGFRRGAGQHQRLRVGQPDILDRHPHQPPGEIARVLAALEHAGRASRAPRPGRSRAPTCGAR